MLRSVVACLTLVITSATLPAFAQRTALPLNDHTRLGQRFTATQRVTAVGVCVPSWSDNEGGLTLTLWDTPDRTRLLARRAFSAIRDNEVVELRPAKPLPPGAYYWEVSERTGQTRVGLYFDPLPAETEDCAYIDGTPDRKRRFLFEVAAAPPPRPGVLRLIADLKSGSPQQQAEACRQLAMVGSATAVPALSRLLGDPGLSHMARYAMENLPDKAVDIAFRAALGTLSGRQLVGVINSMAVRRDAGAIGRLSELLKSANPEVAASSAVALGRIGTPAAAQALIKALARPSSLLRPSLYEGCLNCAGILAASGRRDSAVKLYDRLRSSQAPRAIRTAAARGAVRAHGTGGLGLLRQMLRSSDNDLRDVALWIAQHEAPGRNITLALASELKGLSVETQALLIAALAGRGDNVALPALLSAARAGAKPVRLAAVGALPGLGAAAAPSLVRLLGDPDPELRQAAQDALAGLPPKDVASVATALIKSSDSANRLSAIALAHSLRLSGFGAGLAVALRDPSPEVRLAAAKALEELAGAEQIPALRDAMLGAVNAREADAVEQTLSAVCGRAADREGVAGQLIAGMGQAAPSRRAALLRVVGSVGGARALQAMQEAVAGPVGDVRSAALDVLCAWPTAAAAPDLLRLARGAAAPAEGLRCLRGVLRMAASQDIAADRRLRLCKDAAGLVRRDEEKRLLLGALGGISSIEALDMVMAHLESPVTREEACAAVIGIAEKLVGGPEAARLIVPLERMARTTANPDFAKRAQALLEQAKRTK